MSVYKCRGKTFWFSVTQLDLSIYKFKWIFIKKAIILLTIPQYVIAYGCGRFSKYIS